MKSLIFTLALLVSSNAFAEFKSAQEAETKLKTFTSEKFKGKNDKAVVAMEDDLVDSLIDAVEMKAPKTDSLKKEIVRVAVVLLKQDKTTYGGEIVLPLYKESDVKFRELLKTLPSHDARLLENAVHDARREADIGTDSPDSVK